MIIFLDMDGTVCESRQKITPAVKAALEAQKCPILVISGASREQMTYQLDGLSCTILAQSGNDTPLWQNKLTLREKNEAVAHYKKFFTTEPIGCMEDRGCQMALSFIGHKANPERKKNFDPKQKIRQAILKQHPFKSKTLTVRIAGTTCLDYTKKNGTKGENIKRWIKHYGLNKKDCIYYGDALFKGGNDESVIGVIKTIAVKDPADLLKKLI